MQEMAIAGVGFERVPDRVTKIQNSPEVRFLLICRYYFRLDACAILNHSLKNLLISRQQPLSLTLCDFKQLAIADDSRLDYFKEPGAKFTIRQSGQKFRIGDHGKWLLKSSDEVLSRT